MFTAAKVYSIFRSLLRLFARRQPKDISRSDTTTDVVMTGPPEGRKVMATGFDMQTEIAKLAERIIEPVAVKLTMQERDHVVGRIRYAFEELNIKPTAADTDFAIMALNILQPIQPSLSEPESTRMTDRLRGAMAAFCQSGWTDQNAGEPHSVAKHG